MKVFPGEGPGSPASRSLRQPAAWNLGRLAVPLLIPALFFTVVQLLLPSQTAFEFAADEGGNLMKALLLDRGYTMYSQIWSDQPPLFTHALAAAFGLFGTTVQAGRSTVLLSSCLLLWGAFTYLQLVGGTAQALIGTLVITLLPGYLFFSNSVLIGLPAISLAMVALAALAAWHRNHSGPLLAVSALFLSLSILTKMFTMLLAPVFLLGILLAGRSQDARASPGRRYVPAIVWGAVFSLTLAGLAWLLIGSDNYQTLLQPHLQAQALTENQNRSFSSVAGSSKPFLLLAFAGGVIALRRRRWLLLYPFAWAAVAAAILSLHRPVQSHHVLLVTVPAALLIPSAAGACWRLALTLKSHGPINWRVAFSALLLAGFVSGAAAQVQRTIKAHGRSMQFNRNQNTSGWQIAAIMARYAANTRWVVTDRPMLAFRSQLPVPPSVAVVSEKRVRTGNLDGERMLQIIREVQPEQVALCRFGWPQLLPYLQEHYRQVHSQQGATLYVRSDLVESATIPGVALLPN